MVGRGLGAVSVAVDIDIDVRRYKPGILLGFLSSTRRAAACIYLLHMSAQSAPSTQSPLKRYRSCRRQDYTPLCHLCMTGALRVTYDMTCDVPVRPPHYGY